MLMELILQFVEEVARAFLVEELSGHVHRRIRRWIVIRGRAGRELGVEVHHRNLERLLNRLLTELQDEL